MAFRNRRLDHTQWPYLHIDARYEKIRVNNRVVSQAVLVAVGFNSEGYREILDWRIDDSESEATWGKLFKDLKDRGLQGLKLVVSDAHSGIRAAMSRHFQSVEWQRCRVHFKREMTRKVSHKAYREILQDLASVFMPEEKTECMLRGEEMASKWEPRYPAVARMIREGLEDCLAVLEYPAHHQRKLKSTNMLENLMKRLKKRSRVVGIFPNRASCDRLLGAQLLEVHEKWIMEERSYFNMENVNLEMEPEEKKAVA